MERHTRFGDKMPDRKPVQWGDMRANESTLSDEWNTMVPDEPQTTEKWSNMEPNTPRTSQKWVEMNSPESSFSGHDQWTEMENSGRRDPYSMAPTPGDHSYPGPKGGKSPKLSTKVERRNQVTEAGESREI